MKTPSKRLRSAALFITLLLISSLSYAANPKVKIDTNKGQLTVELYPDSAPETVKNFLSYVDAGLYNSTIIHHVLKDKLIQAGGFNHYEKEIKLLPPIKNEADNGLLNKRGTIAMMHGNKPVSTTSQFFFNLSDNPDLDFRGPTPKDQGYCVFGKVIEGMDTLDKISLVRTANLVPYGRNTPKYPVSIRRISVLDAATQADGNAH